MSDKPAKWLRGIIYCEELGNTDSTKRMRDCTSVEEAYLVFTQRTVYQRAKKLLATSTQPKAHFAQDCRNAIKFLVQGFKNKQADKPLTVESGKSLEVK